MLDARRFHERFVGNASPSALGAVRIVTCLTLFVSVLWEDPASLARVPIELRQPMGVLEAFYHLPIGFEHFVTSAAALHVFETLTAAALLCAAAGLFTRVTLPLGALSYMVVGGLMRQYAWFYHTGLIPFYIAFALSFLPCGDGLSFDAWRRARKVVAGTASKPPPDPFLAAARYGWARYVCWMLIAVPYMLAGFSKLRDGFDPPWWTATNFERIVLGTNLRPMQFDFDGALLLVHAHVPHWFFELLGISAVVSEIGFIAVLFWRFGRVLLPPVMVLLHLGILFLQNILFFDLILLQLIFVDWDWVFARLGKRSPEPATPEPATPEPATPAVHRRYGLASALLLVSLLAWWVTDREYYPFTSMQMFTGAVDTSGVARYQVILARYESGQREEFRVERLIPGFSDTRYRHLINPFAGGRRSRQRADLFLETVAREWNRDAPPGKRVVEFEIQLRHWNFRKFPDDLEHGSVKQTFRHKVGGA